MLTPNHDKECLIADSKSNEDCLDDDKTKRGCEVLTPINDKEPNNDKECVIADAKSSEYSSDDDTTGDEDSSVSLDKSNEPICPGDVILYYCPMSVAGGPHGLRTATVLSVDPNDSMSLVLGNSKGLPSTHLMRRIKVIQNNKLIDHDGSFRQINQFIMIKGGSATAADVLSMQAKLMEIIMTSHIKKGLEKAKAGGFALADMLIDKFNGGDTEVSSALTGAIQSRKRPLDEENTARETGILLTSEYIFPYMSEKEASEDTL